MELYSKELEKSTNKNGPKMKEIRGERGRKINQTPKNVLIKNESLKIASMNDTKVKKNLTLIEEHEFKLNQALEMADNKSTQTRVQALQTCCNVLMHAYLPKVIGKRQITIVDIIEKSLRRNGGAGGEEQAIAAQLAALYVLQLDDDSADERIIKNGIQMLTSAIQNERNSFETRAKCCLALGVICVLAEEKLNNIEQILNQLELIFTRSYQDNTINDEAASLQCSALNTFGLLLTILSPKDVHSMMIRSNGVSIRNLIGLLQSPAFDVRMTSGQIIALIFELGRQNNVEFLAQYVPTLIDTIELLATDSNRYCTKRNLKAQRTTFRHLLKYFQSSIVPNENIRFSTNKSLILNSWTLHQQYESFCMVLGSGMALHLAENEFLREIFQLGLKVTTDLVPWHSYKGIKLEQRLMNAATFKERTRDRNTERDKRCAVLV